VSGGLEPPWLQENTKAEMRKKWCKFVPKEEKDGFQPFVPVEIVDKIRKERQESSIRNKQEI